MEPPFREPARGEKGLAKRHSQGRPGLPTQGKPGPFKTEGRKWETGPPNAWALSGLPG